jgi:nitrite reductase (NO-forming)
MRNWFIGALGVCIILLLLSLPYVAAKWPPAGPSAEKENAPAAESPTSTEAPRRVQNRNQDAPQPKTAQGPEQKPQAQPAASPQPQAQASPLASTPRTPQEKPAPVQAQVQPQPSRSDMGHAHMPSAGTTDQNQAEIAAGRQVYRKCQACHSLDPGKNLVGPSLAGIISRKAGTEQGFNYSPAMKGSNLTWDAKTLDAYLADPQKAIPGNRMPFPGLKSETDRKDVIAFLSAGSPSTTASRAPNVQARTAPAQNQAATGAQPPNQQAAVGAPHAMPDMPDVKYTVRSGIAEGQMVFLGVGGTIDGKVNPVLAAAEGQIVQITLINGEGAAHDIVFPDQNARSARVTGRGASTTIAFQVTASGDFLYYCSVPGHRLAGMEGQFIVTPRPQAQTVAEADISRDPTDVPPPVGKREPQTVRVDLITTEVEARLAEGTTFGFWTFNGKVPGPFLRVRVGDTVEVHLKNAAESAMVHSVDFHAATGPGGGATVLQVDPGKEKSMSFKALVPGLYVYHCATPMVAEHIANGMYGLILVEPEEALPPVDHEFYLMQGEIYTDAPFGQHGSQEFSVEKLLSEHPEYFVFNGAVGALTKLHPLHAKVGETVRLFFGVGGPTFTSSFHVIGEIFDKVYQLGGVRTPPIEGIQTVTVAPGGAVITEFKTHVPGAYSIVDHALARVERGLAGALIVEGAENPAIYDRKSAQTPEHPGH